MDALLLEIEKAHSKEDLLANEEFKRLARLIDLPALMAQRHGEEEPVITMPPCSVYVEPEEERLIS